MRHKDWTKRVVLYWGELRRQDTLTDTSIRRMVLLKQAVTEVTWQMHREGTVGQVVDTRDKVGVAIRAIRAAELGDGVKLARACSQYPALRKLVSQDASIHHEPAAPRPTDIAALKTHTAELLKTGQGGHRYSTQPGVQFTRDGGSPPPG